MMNVVGDFAGETPASTSLPVATVPSGYALKPRQEYTRRHRSFPPTHLGAKLRLVLWDFVESAIAAFSIHGDRPVYDREQFPWIGDIEADWTKVRAELDTVMTHRDAMPSFQEIMKEVSTIQQDDQWKTFFLRGVGMDCAETRADARRP